MREVEYEDVDGRKFLVQIPDDAPDEHAMYGIIVGPPDLMTLGLPTEIEVRLNNQLFNRGLIRRRDARKDRGGLLGALMSVLKVDSQKILELYE